MTRLMYDAVTPTNIPANPQMVAGYINGNYAWSASEWNIYLDASHVTIDVNGARPDADVLDVETGDATPAGAVAWVKSKLARKDSYLPVIYASFAALTPLYNALEKAGYKPGVHFRTWVANWGANIPLKDMTGVTAIQWKNTSGYDISTVYDDKWKAIPPKPTPPPILKGVLVTVPNGVAKNVTSADNGVTWK